MVEDDDYQWLKKEFGPDMAMSAVFRMIIKRLRGERVLNPNDSPLDLLRDMPMNSQEPFHYEYGHGVIIGKKKEVS
jgi:hypothetical protein